MERCQVLRWKHFGRRGSKSSDYFEIALARVAPLYVHSLAAAFRMQVALRFVVFVSAVHALQSPELPVRAA
jgi:hypothetical protein